MIKRLKNRPVQIAPLTSWTYEAMMKHNNVPSELVRFRAMVQDQHESEYALAACTIGEEQQMTLFRSSFEELVRANLIVRTFN